MDMMSSITKKVYPERSRRVFVALSGGVDSSTAAALLTKEGYDVTGVFIKVWQPDFLECTWVADRQDAMRVCAILDIPFLTFDFEKEYKRDVVDHMIREYKAGRTPNPDVMCNSRIKFGAFYQKAREMGADYIATGHYARKEYRIQNIENREDHTQIQPLNSKSYILYSGRDSAKDQTYFLWTLSQGILAHTLFPIGGYEKSDVRGMAAEFGLPTAEKKDSQGLCFIGKLDMKEFLKRFIDEKPGDVLDESGRVIGEHDGAMFYTLGERHGLRVDPTSPSEKPHYVVAKDTEHNTLTVSTDPRAATGGRGAGDVLLESVNWISGTPPSPEEALTARSRYRGLLFDCTVPEAGDNTARIVFSRERPVAPRGQSLVFYRDDECLGGGVIL